MKMSLLRLFPKVCTLLLMTACVSTPSPDVMKQVAERNRWELAHWGNRAIPSADDGQPVVLAFERDRVSGHAGCNRYTAAISFGPSAGEVSVSHGITTRMACEPRRMEFEAAFIKAFEASRRYRLDGESLSFQSEGGPPLEFYRRPLACQASPFAACGETQESTPSR
ncbi:MAG: META domain-containing protein [Nitrospira sp.]|uniref:META domain-containing protein n=1 Tax=Nitrospira defluvii TaxID=330214 RepID=A0ABM8QSQ7_9BACT|nr:META domain-containing protein [Nitrospira defluvii]MCS6328750.1 META domain-containing protein [Nitrospira sp.]CAE6713398.1 META domain-containing protein [Nitrospira defluvii]